MIDSGGFGDVEERAVERASRVESSRVESSRRTFSRRSASLAAVAARRSASRAALASSFATRMASLCASLARVSASFSSRFARSAASFATRIASLSASLNAPHLRRRLRSRGVRAEERDFRRVGRVESERFLRVRVLLGGFGEEFLGGFRAAAAAAAALGGGFALALRPPRGDVRVDLLQRVRLVQIADRQLQRRDRDQVVVARGVGVGEFFRNVRDRVESLVRPRAPRLVVVRVLLRRAIGRARVRGGDERRALLLQRDRQARARRRVGRALERRRRRRRPTRRTLRRGGRVADRRRRRRRRVRVVVAVAVVVVVVARGHQPSRVRGGHERVADGRLRRRRARDARRHRGGVDDDARRRVVRREIRRGVAMVRHGPAVAAMRHARGRRRRGVVHHPQRLALVAGGLALEVELHPSRRSSGGRLDVVVTT
eukprot:31330-Pelagococcus_subviridis.AAC.4